MKKSIFIYVLAMGLTTVSCDDYLDINQDPNSPTEDVISAGMVLPAAEMHLAQSYGDEMRIWGGYFSQQYAHQFGVSNYIAISQYTMTATRSSNVYGQLSSRCQNNLKIVRELSAASEDWGTYLAATTLRAFTYQVLVDAYGEIPYTEALDPSNVTPHYDEGLTVYTGLIAELDEALGRVASTDPVATNFLYAGENAENKCGNACLYTFVNAVCKIIGKLCKPVIVHIDNAVDRFIVKTDGVLDKGAFLYRKHAICTYGA